jgi:hypothetical protein
MHEFDRAAIMWHYYTVTTNNHHIIHRTNKYTPLIYCRHVIGFLVLNSRYTDTKEPGVNATEPGVNAKEPGVNSKEPGNLHATIATRSPSS